MTQHFRYTTLLLLTTLSTVYVSAQSLRKLMEMPPRIIESKWEQTPEGGTELNYYNGDLCSYYLFRENDRSYNLNPGKNTVFRIEKGSNASNSFKTSSRYMFFRGQFPKDFRISTPYALPVKTGEETQWQIAPQESAKTMIFQIQERDTVYATRRGVACATVLPQQLLIYHPDHTFAAYLMMRQNFIQTGEEVMTGQPIGIAGVLGVSISYFFLDNNKFDANGFLGYPYSHFTPVFRTDKGDVKLEEKTAYKSATDDELIMLEMSKREKKKFQKQKYSK
ncbi:M23 family peptidase [Bacteroides thetaiotaomicron]|uniref:M23 family peptidase n=1 Tax=Bacteroides thetaiotaomicron TaxID=818 RepID=UPI00189A25A2|nr:M23 family peptidase [Bacteroides thetaiotaomicron]